MAFRRSANPRLIYAETRRAGRYHRHGRAECQSGSRCGHSMGGFTALHLDLDHPERTLSLTIAGAGYGCEKHLEAGFRAACLDVAETFEKEGAAAFASVYAEGASRVQFQEKDSRGWREFADRLAIRLEVGSALTMRGVQARRDSFWDIGPRLNEMHVPTLILVGDEDDHCMQPGVFLKRSLPSSGLVVFPKSGHTLNLEDPAMFNHVLGSFIAQVTSGTWLTRDPRATTSEIMRTR